MTSEITARLSDIAQRVLYLEGTLFSLSNYPMYKAIYDGRYQSTLLMCGRQVAKSTSLANWIIAESISIPYFKEYYVSPTKEQTITFSNQRVRKTISYSPLVREHFQSPEHADRVLNVSYTNGSENAFTYALDNADRARGFSADRCSYDEVQDMIYDSVIPVINACMLNSKFQYETYAGTPKTMDASIQFLWDRSTQSEWVMKCDGCGSHNCVMSEKSIGLHGPICLKCGKTLNTREGFWLDFKARPDDYKGVFTQGFHIPQAVMPVNIPRCNPGKEAEAQKRWDAILKAMADWSPSRFRNEVLGVSDAIGARLVSLEELKALCTGKPMSSTSTPALTEGIAFAVMGIDWSGGGTSKLSRTAIHVWGWHPGTRSLRTLFAKIYPPANAVADVEDIIRIAQNYNVALVCGDAGEGYLPNDVVAKALGHNRVIKAQYGSQKLPVTWNKVDRWMLDRTMMIDNMMMFLKGKRAIAAQFPPYAEIKEQIQDVLNMFEEVTSAGKKIWTHSPKQPDDGFHAMLFGWLAFRMVLQDVDFTK